MWAVVRTAFSGLFSKAWAPTCYVDGTRRRLERQFLPSWCLHSTGPFSVTYTSNHSCQCSTDFRQCHDTWVPTSFHGLLGRCFRILSARNIYLYSLIPWSVSDPSSSSLFLFVMDCTLLSLTKLLAMSSYGLLHTCITQRTVRPFPIYDSLRAVTLPPSIILASVPHTL